MQPPYYKEIQKQHLLPVTTQEQGLNKSRSAGYSGGLFRGDTFWPVLSICAILYLTLFPLHASVEPDINATCPVQHTVAPGPSEALDAKLAELQSASYFNQSLTYWQHAIQVETQSFDEQGSVKDDPQRYVHLAKFEAMLKREFGETVFKKLHFEKVNTYGFLFTWPGSDESLKPAVYMGHYDTVPFGDAEAWTHHPLSGFYDGEMVWGRGSLDDKNALMAIMESVHALVQAGFEPRRTMLLSFGFDEELMKRQPEGSRPLAQRILELYGENGVEMIHDEGGLGIQPLPGGDRVYALPSTSEKGYLDVQVTVKSQGGHSSVPPKHTGIGIMAEVIHALEAHPHAPGLSPDNPLLAWMFCLLDDPSVDQRTKKMIRDAATGQSKRTRLAEYLVKTFPMVRPLLTTTQAADVIQGGVKANALPESTSLIVNHRIALHSNIADLKEHLTKVLSTLSKKLEVPLFAFEDDVKKSEHGIYVEALNPLDVAPVSPLDSNAWVTVKLHCSVNGAAHKLTIEQFSGAIRHVFGEDVVVAPSIMTGNTDTKEYHDISKNIYRFTPIRDGAGIHSLDERGSLKGHLDVVRFYFELMRIVNG